MNDEIFPTRTCYPFVLLKEEQKLRLSPLTFLRPKFCAKEMPAPLFDVLQSLRRWQTRGVPQTVPLLFIGVSPSSSPGMSPWVALELSACDCWDGWYGRVP